MTLRDRVLILLHVSVVLVVSIFILTYGVDVVDWTWIGTGLLLFSSSVVTWVVTIRDSEKEALLYSSSKVLYSLDSKDYNEKDKTYNRGDNLHPDVPSLPKGDKGYFADAGRMELFDPFIIKA